MAAITITTLQWAPPVAQGLVRDLRVRWALEEAGLDYDVRLIGRQDQSSESYRRLQPFGKVPVYEEGGLTLFESGAIVLHIAERSKALMPADTNGRARVIAWLFAALNSIEPDIMHLVTIDIFNTGQEWAKLRRPAAVDMVKARLACLRDWLGDREYLENRFTAADLLMTTVLRILRHTDLVKEIPELEAYRLRCEARPAFRKALADQMATFAENAPKEQEAAR
jgi:glutathione S-transferase